eukprot:TRINITY_DN14351_c0_g1_i1.p1 TRINITY_DN14351_c0_g1~~TRINITY_DN14351_c0_g1_i1.p1  ORF type:complete len:621 (+),score=110.90 TRINITY_DN14351_c0_g1_i1:23-1885(+)
MGFGLERADFLSRSGKIDEALHVCEKIKSRKGDTIKLRILFLRTLLKRNRYQEAYSEGEDLLRPSNSYRQEARLTIISLWIEAVIALRRFHQGEEILNRELENTSEDKLGAAKLMIYLGQLYLKRLLYQKAFEKFQMAEQLAAENLPRDDLYNLHKSLAEVLIKLLDFDQADRQSRLAIEISKDIHVGNPTEFALAYQQLADALSLKIFETNNYEDFEEACILYKVSFDTLSKLENEELKFLCLVRSFKLVCKGRNVVPDMDAQFFNLTTNISETLKKIRNQESVTFADGLYIYVEALSFTESNFEEQLKEIDKTINIYRNQQEQLRLAQSLELKGQILHSRIKQAKFNVMDEYSGLVEEIIQYYQDSIDQEIALAEPKDGCLRIASVYSRLGKFYAFLKDFGESSSNFQRAYKIYSRFFQNKENIRTLTALVDLGVAQLGFNQLEKAVNNLREAERRLNGKKGGNEALALCYYNLGVANVQTHHYENALKYYRESLELRKRFKESPQNNVSIIQCHIGIAECERADNLSRDHVIPHLEEVLREFQPKFTEKPHRIIADLKYSIAAFKYQDNRKSEALPEFEECRSLLLKFYPENHPTILEKDKIIKALQGMVSSQLGKK